MMLEQVLLFSTDSCIVGKRERGCKLRLLAFLALFLLITGCDAAGKQSSITNLQFHITYCAPVFKHINIQYRILPSQSSQAKFLNGGGCLREAHVEFPLSVSNSCV